MRGARGTRTKNSPLGVRVTHRVSQRFEPSRIATAYRCSFSRSGFSSINNRIAACDSRLAGIYGPFLVITPRTAEAEKRSADLLGRSAALRYHPAQTADLERQVRACILISMLVSGVKHPKELVGSGGGGRSVLRPGSASRACRVDRPPALFSHAEENLRPQEPAYSSSTGEGSGSGDPDSQLNSRRVR